jgi:hypothetical protein
MDYQHIIPTNKLFQHACIHVSVDKAKMVNISFFIHIFHWKLTCKFWPIPHQNRKHWEDKVHTFKRKSLQPWIFLALFFAYFGRIVGPSLKLGFLRATTTHHPSCTTCPHFVSIQILDKLKWCNVHHSWYTYLQKINFAIEMGSNPNPQ